MTLEFEHRASESPWVERVWRSRSTDTRVMTSVARVHWDLVFWEDADGMHAGIQGPESRASEAAVPPQSEFLGVRLAQGAFLPEIPATELVDTFVPLPVDEQSFWLGGTRIRFPQFETAENAVHALTRHGVLSRADPKRDAAASERTRQRRALAATGLPDRTRRQIQRAARAAVRLQAGESPAAVAQELGYFDQPHLAHALRRFVGRTATELATPAGAVRPLSLLYKTEGDGVGNLPAEPPRAARSEEALWNNRPCRPRRPASGVSCSTS